MKEFKSISLCNIIYKILSKTLANILKSILPKLISEEQYAFIVGRSIGDNVLMASKINHHMRNMRRRKTSDMALKVEISKAYDKVDWGYLRAIMDRMGFDKHGSTNWIMRCVTLINFVVRVNNDMVEPIVLERGLR